MYEGNPQRFFLSDLPATALTSIAERLKPRRYRKDETVFTDGDASYTLYLIESGQVEITLAWEQKEEVLAYSGSRRLLACARGRPFLH